MTARARARAGARARSRIYEDTHIHAEVTCKRRRLCEFLKRETPIVEEKSMETQSNVNIIAKYTVSLRFPECSHTVKVHSTSSRRALHLSFTVKMWETIITK